MRRMARLLLVCLGIGMLPQAGWGMELNMAVEERAPLFTPEEEAVLARAREMSRALEIIAAKVKPSVVNIRAENPLYGTKQGSGVIVDTVGYILTNAHVVEDAATIYVKLHDGREMQAEHIGSNLESDVAVIRIQVPGLIPARLGDSDAIQVGAWVLAIGNPLGLESTITSGIVSAKGRVHIARLRFADFIQTDAPINTGNSGGPLVDLYGEVIGINSASGEQSEGLNFAIPINLARSIMNGIIAHKKAVYSDLGVRLQPITPELAQVFRLNSVRGALVSQVFGQSPGAAAGLRTGDVILRYRNRDVIDDTHLRTLVATTEPGTMVPIELIRQGKRVELHVQVEARPEKLVMALSEQILRDLGIQEVSALTDALRESLGYDAEAHGVVVESIRPDSLAKEKGMNPGSLILRVDGNRVETPEELYDALGRANPYQGIDLSWRYYQFHYNIRLINR